MTALVSVRHRSEFHILYCRVQHPDLYFVILMPDPLFVAKIGHPESHLQDVHLKTLPPFVSPDVEVDTYNCMVRAIKIYLARTKGLRKGWKRFFMAFKPGHTGRSSLPPSPSGLPSLSILSVIILLRTLHVSSESEPMTYGSSPPVGMPTKGLTSRHPACDTVAFPHELHLCLPCGGWGRPQDLPLGHYSTSHELALDPWWLTAQPRTQAGLSTGLWFGLKVYDLGCKLDFKTFMHIISSRATLPQVRPSAWGLRRMCYNPPSYYLLTTVQLQDLLVLLAFCGGDSSILLNINPPPLAQIHFLISNEGVCCAINY